ncbi:hypothetical protein BMS3Bbin06_02256 [bacterium BMS3Bbin06]|nr:hypothetical protein BMS3Bbin06_02256 [bacterium BMS3Bbin06]HDO36966.1 NusG domain II-containing protein [Nitrospirota bacterium]HDY70099.1 NusG domain II-containing protein [Nitrospirota bacterium]
MSLLKKTIKETSPLDWILLVFLLFFSLTGFIFVGRLMPAGETVIVEVNGKTVYKLALSEDRIVDVKGPIGITKVEVKDGRVRVLYSPCPEKIGMKQGWIRRGVIICVPNRVVVSIKGGKVRGVDAITG